MSINIVGRIFIDTEVTTDPPAVVFSSPTAAVVASSNNPIDVNATTASLPMSEQPSSVNSESRSFPGTASVSMSTSVATVEGTTSTVNTDVTAGTAGLSLVPNNSATETAADLPFPRIGIYLIGSREYMDRTAEGDGLRDAMSYMDAITLGLFEGGPWDNGDSGHFQRDEIINWLHANKKGDKIRLHDYFDVMEATNDSASNQYLYDETGPPGAENFWVTFNTEPTPPATGTPVNDWWARQQTGEQKSTFGGGGLGGIMTVNITDYVTPDAQGRRAPQVYADRKTLGHFDSIPSVIKGPEGVGGYMDVMRHKPKTNDNDFDGDGQDDDARDDWNTPGTQGFDSARKWREGQRDCVLRFQSHYPSLTFTGNGTSWNLEYQGTDMSQIPAFPVEYQGLMEGSLAEGQTLSVGKFPFSGIYADGTDVRSDGDPNTNFGRSQLALNNYVCLMRGCIGEKIVMNDFHIEMDLTNGINPTNFPSFLPRYAMGMTAMDDGFVSITADSDRGTVPMFDYYGTINQGTTGLGKGWLGQPIDPPQTAPRYGDIWIREFDNGIVIWHANSDGSDPAATIDVTGPSGIGAGVYTRIIGVQDPVHDDGEVVNSNFSLNTKDAIFLKRIPVAVSSLTQIRETPEQIALFADVTGTVADDVAATVRYREVGGSTWADAHPLYRVRPNQAEDAFSGIIFDLDPGASYEVEVTYTNGTTFDVRGLSEHGSFTTSALPADAGAATSTPSNISAIESAVSAASPGDVIEIQDNTYNLTNSITITQSGTINNPIYIRGQSRSGVVMNATTGGRVFEVRGDYIVIENMAMEGNYPDDDVSQLRSPIRLATTAPTTVTGVTLRDCVISGYPTAIQTTGGSSGGYSHDCLVYNNTMTGTLQWTTANLSVSIFQNDGIRLVGHGNCVWNNTLEGYSDAIAFAHSTDEPSVTLECNYAYRNYLRNCHDNVFEIDHSERLHGIYDNYCENISTGVSQSDNGAVRNYGPTYLFRNIFANFAERFVKLNDSWEGWHHYNNTYIRTRGVAGQDFENDGYVQNAPTGDSNTRWAYKNNIHIRVGAITGDLLNFRVSPPGVECDVSNNAWYPDGSRMRWENFGPSYTSGVTEAIAATQTHANVYPASAGLSVNNRWHEFDQLSEANPWDNTLSLGVRSDTELTGKTTLEIASSSALKNAGVEIPGVTNDYIGAAPDMGAVIEGRPAVEYGSTQAPSWFSSAAENTWFTVPLSNTAQDVGAVQGTFQNFTGSGVDQANRGLYKSCCGGHTIDFRNATFKLDLNQEVCSWERLIDDTLNTGTGSGNTGDGSNPDGTPIASHNYNGGPWILNDTLWLPWLTGQYAAGPSGTQVWGLDLSGISNAPITAVQSAPLWTHYGHGVPEGQSLGLSTRNYEASHGAYDYDTDTMWMTSQFCTLGGYCFYSVDATDGTITQFPVWPQAGQYPGPTDRTSNGSSFIVDGYWVQFAPRAADQTGWIIDLSDPTSTTQMAMSNQPNWSDLLEAGAVYDPSTRRAYFKNRTSTTIITLDVPANPEIGTYTWGTIAAGTSPTGIGRFSHFNVVYDMGDGRGALIYSGDGYQGDVYMYKLPTN